MTRWPLVVPPVVLCLLDIGLTLAGQSAAYWAGDYTGVGELNPLARLVLRVSPWLFLAFGLGWAAGFVVVLLALPPWLARPLAYVLTAAHTIGAASWLLTLGRPGVLLCVLLAVVVRSVWSSAPTTVCPNEGERLQ